MTGARPPGAPGRRWRVPLALAAAAILIASALGVRALRSRRPNDRADPTEREDDWFAFTPAPDSFSPSPIDLRSMNEPQAGDGGFIVARGDEFVHGRTGEPIRFWGVNVAPGALTGGLPRIEQLARFLAKRGVNLARFQGTLWRDDDFTVIDPVKLDRLHALAAALKREGIYLALSTYFPLFIRPRDGPGFEGYDGKQFPFGLPFFSPAFQRLQRSWLQAILTRANPYTHLPLAADPALAFVEILNEDSLFFWTFNPRETVPAPQMALLEAAFGRWLQHRHGTIAAAFRAWGGSPLPDDDAAAGRAGILSLQEILGHRETARAQETAAFLAETQRAYFDGMLRYIKSDLGFGGSVTGSNWVTADAPTFGPLDKWSNSGADFMDRHGYFEGRHQGPRATYRIDPGDRYDDAIAIKFDDRESSEPRFDLPIMDLAYKGKPSTISELGWLPPNRYRADLPLLAAGYGALQGSDAMIFFTITATSWADRIEKFTLADPVGIGQFPATAILYRRGLVKAADPVVHLSADLPSLEQLHGLPLAPTEGNLDHLRAVARTYLGRAAPAQQRTVDPLAYLVGRVEVELQAPPATPSTFADLTPWIDRARGTVTSTTQELRWNWKRGVAQIDAPAAQGATGLLGRAGRIPLRDIAVTFGDPFGSVLLVALDGAPLASSRSMLLQVMSEDVNHGWRAPGRGLRPILDVGGPPLLVRKLAGTVAFSRPDAAGLMVSALDWNGYAREPPRGLGASATIALQPEVFYYLIEKR